MADTFQYTTVSLESPLVNAAAADFSATDHTFATVPRALNCSAEGTLTVDIGSATSIAIHVVAGLNPYRVSKIYNTGSDAITVVGMW